MQNMFQREEELGAQQLQKEMDFDIIINTLKQRTEFKQAIQELNSMSNTSDRDESSSTSSRAESLDSDLSRYDNPKFD